MDKLTYDLFVSCRNVIIVKWIYDNPEYFRVQKDLYDMQVYIQLLTRKLWLSSDNVVSK